MKMNVRKRFSAQYFVVFIFLIFLIVSIMTGFIFQITKTRQYNSEISKLNKQIVATDNEINNMKNTNIKKYGSDLEDIARKRLNMVKSNEIVYIDIEKEDN